MLRLFNSTPSGNCYKVRLLLAQLERPYERIEIDVVDRSKPRPAEVLKHNPHGRVPLLVLEDGRGLPESNAILWHLAEGTRFLPDDAYERAQVLRWLFWEQNAHEPAIAVVRYLVSIGKTADRHPELVGHLRGQGENALKVMETHLSTHGPWFVGQHYSIADICLYAYTHVAHEGGFDLAPFGGIRSWIERVQGEPWHVPLL